MLYGDVQLVERLVSVDAVRHAGTTFDVSETTAFRADSTLYLMHSRTTPDRGERKPERFLLRQVVAGNIDAYTYASTEKESIDFYAVGGGPLQEATTERLRRTLQQSPASQRWLRKSRRWAFAEYGLIGAGLAVTGYGVHTYLTKATGAYDFNAYLPLGFVIGLTSGYPRHEKRRAWRNALSAYGE